ncbi:MAG: hypothetical protein COV48_05990 [Elusimicrobia bacterium CG11_big_fil_rev_8_21_14_0_20_64_6]|nr:MAG: hypothetical protein COV48_05990 [Elusimicrobia bacterium CG11_big_fil_rev_8_21_14_0_20_64_6]
MNRGVRVPPRPLRRLELILLLIGDFELLLHPLDEGLLPAFLAASFLLALRVKNRRQQKSAGQRHGYHPLHLNYPLGRLRPSRIRRCSTTKSVARLSRPG